MGRYGTCVCDTGFRKGGIEVTKMWPMREQVHNVFPLFMNFRFPDPPVTAPGDYLCVCIKPICVLELL